MTEFFDFEESMRVLFPTHMLIRQHQDLGDFIQPKPGLGVVFPGYMMHMVEPVRTSAPRISISCNMTFALPPADLPRYRSGM